MRRVRRRSFARRPLDVVVVVDDIDVAAAARCSTTMNSGSSDDECSARCLMANGDDAELVGDRVCLPGETSAAQLTNEHRDVTTLTVEIG